jgi:membrane associated rhomboid family serine protease
MNELNMHPLEAILRFCAEAAPNPWYPSTFSEVSGIPREQLDPLLDELRLGGLIRLTDWVQGRGQGYALTPAGTAVVENPRLLEKLRANGAPRQPVSLRPAAARPARPGDMQTWDRGEMVREVFLNPTRPTVTLSLMFVNIMVFLAGVVLAIQRQVPWEWFLTGKSDPKVIQLLSDTGAVQALQLMDGQWWRLLTSCFVHIGLLHLAVNMYGLYVLGPLVERMFGHARYLLLYLVAGLGGSCLGMLLAPGEFQQFQAVRPTLLAGASGAIYGLLAAIAAWTYLNRHFLPPPLVSSIYRNLVINSILFIVIGLVPGVSMSGHVGGAGAGLLAAILLNYQRFGSSWRRLLALLGVLLIPAACFVALLKAPDYDQRWKNINAIYQLFIKGRELMEQREEEQHNLEAALTRVRKIENDRRVAEAEDKAEELIRQDAAKRDRQLVGKTIAAIQNARIGLATAEIVLRRAGPFEVAREEKKRQLRIEYLRARFQLFQFYLKCLQQGENWTREDARGLDRQQEETKRLKEDWQEEVNRD